ncbi:MAG: GNAT family N-acetyltransferase [Clostridia bacterium]|nr:GNAT family N-acetyltransferase [Clostridia bacterium]
MMERARQLYAQSFPVYEQRQYASQARIMGHEQYHYGMIMEEDAFLGLILYWETADFIYVEHFCMMEQVRGQGLGSRALALLGRGGKTVILEIDPPVDAVSMRRKGFYERAGFCANPYPHVHPPYDRAHTGHALTVMSYPQGLTPVQYERFARYLSQTVMDHVF